MEGIINTFQSSPFNPTSFELPLNNKRASEKKRKEEKK